MGCEKSSVYAGVQLRRMAGARARGRRPRRRHARVPAPLPSPLPLLRAGRVSRGRQGVVQAAHADTGGDSLVVVIASTRPDLPIPAIVVKRALRCVLPGDKSS